MTAAKWAFGFMSVVLVGCGISTYFTQPNDGSGHAVSIFLGIAGFVALLISWNVQRLFGRPSKSFDGEDVGDIYVSHHDHDHDGGSDH
jgi:hypothetical protein